jgi:hypothetical protein
MARRLIDGMVVNVPEEDAPQVGVDIDDAMYAAAGGGDELPPNEVYTAEDYAQAIEAYDSAQKLLLLCQCEGFTEQMRYLKENSDFHRAAELRYTGLDATKVLGLRLDRICADHALKLITELIENAQATPRPIFVQQ